MGELIQEIQQHCAALAMPDKHHSLVPIQVISFFHQPFQFVEKFPMFICVQSYLCLGYFCLVQFQEKLERKCKLHLLGAFLKS